MPKTLNIFAGRRTDGSPVDEEVLVEPLGGRRYKLLKSPGLVLGVAADDVFDLKDGGRIEVVSRGQNLCIQLFFKTSAQAMEREASRRMAELGGRLDGKSAGELVYTVPVATGFNTVENALRHIVAEFPDVEWYYGNVYDPVDGVTPLNWW